MDFETLENELNIVFDEQTKKNFLNYIRLFKEYNSHTNLISKNDEKFFFEKHIFDSFALNLFFKKYFLPKNMLDIGTGGGFPSVPIAILFKNTDVCAVDSIAKKIKFLELIKEEFNLKNLQPQNCRIEDLPVSMKESFDMVTTRALGSLRMILEYAVPYLKVGGYFVAFKSVESETEINQSENAMKILGVKLEDTINYKLPLEENFERKLLIFKKVKKCSDIYPRKNGVIKKQPL